MAKKNNHTTETENGEQEEAVQPPPSTLTDKHAEATAARRELEAELAAIPSHIRDAINAGDVDKMAKLTARKSELPNLFVAASMAETKARQAVFNAEDDANLKRLSSAESARDKAEAALLKRKAEVEVELAKLAADLEAAALRVTEAYDAIDAARNLGGACEAGFRKSLASLVP